MEVPLVYEWVISFTNKENQSKLAAVQHSIISILLTL